MTRVSPDNAEFVRRTEPYRRELLAHCYRMLGSIHDADDLVQETYLRAWRSYDRFEDRSSVRTWLYRIATNACLSALRNRSRRPLPSGLGGPGDDPHATPEMAGPEVTWLQPVPDALVGAESDDPAAIVASRESLRLALIASLQYLPGRQRAVLLLRDVLAWSASEVAEVLDTSVAAVKSTLQRARARLDEVTPSADRVAEPTEPQARALLDRYMAAFENADTAAIEKLLREDAVLEMPPSRTWFSGRRTCAPYIINYALGAPGDWRMVPTRANGQPAAAAYLRAEDGTYQAFGIAVLTLAADGIARIVAFGDPDLLAAFGFPPTYQNS
ncbi:sigma-70 family RNA polymerase sigma factor [Pseudonocardia acaciae]|uniref:sigma-70 family RNA polymerase sigma factor n=1 Tax=Pseudonocardia acaciae TaxID=551276 RepID=UPI0005620EDD|nr:sigma-70 family RNA polymerase sigma factor [Pseudonocardia acaciae]